MKVEDFEITITKCPRDDEEEGSVVLLGNRSKKAWLEEMKTGGGYELTGEAMTNALYMLNTLDQMGIHTDVKAIELKVHGEGRLVAARNGNGNGEFGYRVVHDKDGSNG